MWSDSKTTISWIKSDHRRYKPFVAHRVNEILEGSELSDWRWLSSEMNPADFGTRIRSNRRQSFCASKPSFLLESQSDWPEQVRLEETDEEMRAIIALL